MDDKVLLDDPALLQDPGALARSIDLLAEAGILVDLILTVSVLTWIGSQGNAWLRNSAVNGGFKVVQGE